jgi:hypothetical protein
MRSACIFALALVAAGALTAAAIAQAERDAPTELPAYRAAIEHQAKAAETEREMVEFWIAALWLVCCLVAWHSGAARQAALASLILALFFGPIGLAISLLLDGRRRCPACHCRLFRQPRTCPGCHGGLIWTDDGPRVGERLPAVPSAAPAAKPSLTRRATRPDRETVAPAPIDQGAVGTDDPAIKAYQEWQRRQAKGG